MSFTNKIVKLVSVYMVSEVLIMAASFLSFPILTRILTKADYGILNIIGITVGFVEALSTLGLRHAVQRFYSEYLTHGSQGELYSTAMKVSAVSGSVGTIFLVGVLTTLALFKFLDQSLYLPFIMASLLVVVRTLSKMSGCMFRVNEHAKTYSVLAVVEKYVSMSGAILLVSFTAFGVVGFYGGLLGGETLVLVAWLAVLVHRFGLPNRKYSPAVLRKMTSYGLPIVTVGFASVVLTMGDRYIIGYLLNAESVATYSVPYNLCAYIAGIMITAFEFAFVPAIMKEISEGGAASVRAKIENTIRLYCFIAIPAVFGVCAMGKALIILLASSKYADSTSILPYIITGEMAKGMLLPMMVGLQHANNTSMLARATWLAAGINLVLNVALIPVMGLQGSALATLVSYVFLMVMVKTVSTKHIYFRLPFSDLGKYLGSSVIMYLVLVYFARAVTGNPIVGVVVGVATYIVVQLLIDQKSRAMALSYIAGIRGKWGGRNAHANIQRK